MGRCYVMLCVKSYYYCFMLLYHFSNKYNYAIITILDHRLENWACVTIEDSIYAHYLLVAVVKSNYLTHDNSTIGILFIVIILNERRMTVRIFLFFRSKRTRRI